MSEYLYDALDDCVAALLAGADLEAVLDMYPDLADQLRPLLETSEQLVDLTGADVPVGTLHRSRTRLLQHAHNLKTAEPQSRHGGFWIGLPRFAFALLLALFVFLGSSALVVASAQTIPGDALYPVKRTLEKINLTLPISREKHIELEAKYQERRLEEVKGLLAAQRSVLVSFMGDVSQISQTAITVGGIHVRLTPETIIIGHIEPGMRVEVDGITQMDGTVLASEVHLKTLRITGMVERMDGDSLWINGQEIIVTQHTEKPIQLQPGDIVTVLVQTDDLGIHEAILIAPAEQPALETTAVVTPEPTPEPQPQLINFEGTVRQVFPNRVLVDGRVVYTGGMETMPQVGLGDVVAVQAYVNANGQLVAQNVELIQPAVTAQPDEETETQEMEAHDDADDESEEESSADDDKGSDDTAENEKSDGDDAGHEKGEEEHSTDNDKTPEPDEDHPDD